MGRAEALEHPAPKGVTPRASNLRSSPIHLAVVRQRPALRDPRGSRGQRPRPDDAMVRRPGDPRRRKRRPRELPLRRRPARKPHIGGRDADAISFNPARLRVWRGFLRLVTYPLTPATTTVVGL